MPSIQQFPMKLESDNDGDAALLIDIARPEEAEEIADFFSEYLLYKAPVVHLVARDSSPEAIKERHAFFLDYIRECLLDLLSFTVRNAETGQLVAIRVNKLECLLDGDDGQSHKSYPPMPDQLVFAALGGLGDGCNLYDLYETDKVLHLFAVAVHPSQARRGLASRLYRLSIELALTAGAGAIAVEAFSQYAIRATTKLGFEVHRVMNFESFEYHGKRPLAECTELLAEHPEARFMARRLP